METKHIDIYCYVKNGIISGYFKDHEALPSVRVMAERFKVNASTARKAYKKLEKEGYITIQPYAAAFVSVNKSKIEKTNTDELVKFIDKAVILALINDFKEEEFLDIARERFEKKLSEVML